MRPETTDQGPGTRDQGPGTKSLKSRVTGHGSLIRSLVTGLWSLVIFCLLLSCGAEGPDEGEDHGDILDSAEGLTLTEEEHEVGWGKAECTLCHQLENIHLENRTGLPIDIDLIHDEAIEDGNDGCPDCHGDNGVP